MEIVILICSAVFCSTISHFFIQKLSRSALLELQLEHSYALSNKYSLYVYQLIDLFRINTPLTCEACPAVHRLKDYFSFVALAKKCRQRSFFKLFASELFFFLLFMIYYLHYGFGFFFLIIAISCPLFFMITVIDFKYFIIPDQLNLAGVILGIVVNILLQLYGIEGWGWQKSFLGLFIAAGTLKSVAYVSALLLKREAMGGGDIKLMAFIGALFGTSTALLSLAISAIIGSFFGLFAKFYAQVIQKKEGYTMIAYGPYIILATLLVLYFGDEKIIAVYEHYAYQFVVYYLGI